MALIGLIGALVLCGLLMAGLKNVKHAHESSRLNNMNLH
jgi:hypothetical protein